MKRINRREFIKMGLSSLSVMAVGSHIPGMFGKNNALAQVPSVNLTITDALVEMIDLTPVYHWVYADEEGPRFPGPLIIANEGANVTFNITNGLDEPHAVAISGTKINSGLINPGQEVNMGFTAPAAGTYIYYDPLNAPVNRVLGLHGVLIVLPVGVTNNPYSNPTLTVQQLFNDLGTTAHFPGNPWNPARTFVWVVHQIDPVLNALAAPAGAPPINRVNFVNQFLPRYFTITGKSGHFVTEDEEITPHGRVGQPALVRIVNTGLVTESLHIHANHVYPTSINGVVQSNVQTVDTMTSGPMDRVDWLVPFKRPPDIPVKPGNPGGNPPFQNQPVLRFDMSEELAFITPDNNIQLSPLDYPMHDHMEQSQTAAGGNYNAGLLSHIIITGDIDGVDFPKQQG